MDTSKAKNLLGQLAELFDCELSASSTGYDIHKHEKAPYEVGGTKLLKDKYGEGKTRTIINRAIRAEIPGGAKVLDARTELHKQKNQSPAVQLLDQALFEFENQIRSRYGMKLLDPT